MWTQQLWTLAGSIAFEMKAFWFNNENNFGDNLTPWLIEKISGQSPEFSSGESSGFVHMACGSILNIPVEGSVVWGSGFARCTDPVVQHGKVLAVRGPKSREKLLAHGVDCPNVCGDPAILLPRFFNPKPDKKFRLAVIPHYVDYEAVCKAYDHLKDEVQIVSLLEPVEEVIRKICECDVAISSSLHGIITAHAYEVPCAWVEFSDKVEGCGFKFHDYFASGGLPLVNPINLRFMPADLLEVERKVSSRLPEIDADALYAACPFKP